MLRTAVVISLLTAAAVLFSCSRGHDGLPDAAGAPLPDALAGDAEGLPGLDGLPSPARELSIVGPGWFPLVPREALSSLNAIPAPPDGLTLDAALGHAFAVYGVWGFDGDNGPTSVRLTVTDVTGEFYASFSDYLGDRWSLAGPFTDTVTAEIPNTDEYTSPTAFTSPGGVSYVAVIAAEGNAVTITGLELGVHGGSLGPAPPTLFSSDGGGEAGLLLSWTHSADLLDPDFAGYSVERAPLLWGDFEQLGAPEPTRSDNFLDETCPLDEMHRYRVAAVDASDNMSVWRNLNAVRLSGTDTDPVAVLNIPHGPLFGPVNVTFDLSQSYDPMNPGVPSPSIDHYEIALGYSPAGYAGPNPAPNLLLQPGCYIVAATVEVTADLRSNTTYGQLVVYPQWQDSSTLVNAASLGGLNPRLHMPRAARNPATEKVAIFGYDRTNMLFDIWYQTGPGRLDLYTLPVYGTLTGGVPVRHIGEPVVYRDSILAPVTAELSFSLAAISDEGPEWLGVATNDGTAIDCAAASDGDSEIWVLYARDNGGTPELVIASIVASKTNVIVPDLIDGLYEVAAAYNPTTGLVDVCYVWEDVPNFYIGYKSWDPVNDAVVSETLPHVAMELSSFGWLDIEYNPVSQRAAIIYLSYNDNFNHFRELEADGVTWTVDVVIDNSDVNHMPDLAFGGPDNRAYAFFAVDDLAFQISHLYELDTGVWSVRNTASYSADSGYFSALMAIPGSEDLIALDVDVVGDTFLVTAHAGDTDTLWSWWQFGTDYLPNSSGQAYDLHGTAGSDGLHALWMNMNSLSAMATHATSPDGAVWALTAAPTGASVALDLTATSDGAVYLSGVLMPGNSARLMWWDGAAWQLRQGLLGSIYHRPFLSAQPAEELVRWAAYTQGTGQMHYVDGNELGGYADTPIALVDVPVWLGVIQNAGGGMWGARYFTLAGAVNPDDSRLGLFSDGGDTLDTLLYPLYDEPLFHLLALETWGHSLAASFYQGPTYPLPTEVYWAVQGSLTDPFRYEDNLFEDPVLTTLPAESDPYPFGARRTASAGLAWGTTAVGLLSTFDGGDVHFEWSHFGEWEELPFPAGIYYMSSPELIIGMDGRWHIIYKDHIHDRIYCRSTLP